MLDLAMVRTEPERVIAALARRGLGPETARELVELDARWTGRREARETLRQRRRRISEEVARAKEENRDTSALEALGRQVAGELAALETEMGDLDARRQAALDALPNLPSTDTPDQIAEVRAPSDRAPSVSSGSCDPADESLASRESAPELTLGARSGAPVWAKPFAPLHHADLLEMLGLARTPRSAGHGFLIWRGGGARLVRALTNFMLDVHTREFGCEEVQAPAMATRAALTGSAHLPLLEDKMYRVAPEPAEPGAVEPAAAKPGAAEPGAAQPGLLEPAAEAAGDAQTAQDLFLAPRAEPHLASLFAGEILEASRLPVRLVSAGPAFRREAGGGGAAGRGLLRLHEFPTVEVYVFCRPDQAEAQLAHAVAAAEAILTRLEVPHRRRLRPAPGLSRAAAKTIDLDVWAPGLPAADEKGSGEKGSDPLSVEGSDPFSPSRGRWLPVAALSTFTDYQARCTNTRYRDAAGRTRFVYTIGGAAVALPHLVAAMLENGQEADGSVRLPPALGPYFGEERLHA